MSVWRKKTTGLKTKKRLLPLVLAAALCSSPVWAEEATFTANFKDTDLKSFIETVGANLNKTIIMGPGVQGKVSIRTMTPLNERQYYQLFLNLLEAQGYAVVPMENDVLKVVKSSAAKVEPLPLVGEGSDNYAGDEMVTKVVPVRNVSVRELAPILRQMIDSAGSGNVVNYDPSNVIMLTGRASVVERLTEVIQRVDHAGNRTEEVIPLDNASASEIARVLESLTKNSGENQPATLKSQISQQLTAQLRQLLHKPHGIFLVTGPTGSGKSTTLYAGLQELNNHSRNILTVEDPIEYMIEGIGQTQVNTRVGMTFARGLRAILRQDPDVVMVGEIRDTETAEIAVQASLTGHLVLSTLHTNTAVGAITRLQDMGVEPFLLSSSLTGVMAQRLVRTLCPDCRQPAPATDEEKRLLGITDARTVTLYHPQGCPACNHKGFRGRTAIHELIVVDATLRDLIHRQAGELELERYVRQHSAGIRSNGIEKVLAGETSLDEVLRVTMEA
nr:ATPase, T2SS/T4P/T4SS family [Escherichia coli]